MLITQLSLNLLCHPVLLSLALPSLAQFSALKQGHVLPHRAPTYVKDVQPTFLLHPSQCLPTFVTLQWISSPGTADLSPQHFRIAQVVLLLLITFMCTLPAAQSGAPWSFSAFSPHFLPLSCWYLRGQLATLTIELPHITQHVYLNSVCFVFNKCLNFKQYSQTHRCTWARTNIPLCHSGNVLRQTKWGYLMPL